MKTYAWSSLFHLLASCGVDDDGGDHGGGGCSGNDDDDDDDDDDGRKDLSPASRFSSVRVSSLAASSTPPLPRSRPSWPRQPDSVERGKAQFQELRP